jgi:lipocalin
MNTKILFMLLLMPMLLFCSGKKSNLEVVEEVDLEKYTGTWYEIARLPNRFEKGLKCVTATYKMREDGKITVINRGHRIDNPQEKEEVTGWAKVPNKNEPGKLKVTFFWPFFGKYWILRLDSEYEYALVGSPSRKYLWILSRHKKIDEELYNTLLAEARNKGFNTSAMIKTAQDCEMN